MKVREFFHQRAEEMKRLRFAERWSLERIGEEFGVSRQRVYQIVGESNMRARYNKSYPEPEGERLKLKNGMKLQNHYTREVVVVENFKRKGEIWNDEWFPHALLRVIESPKPREVGKTSQLIGFLLDKDWDIIE